METLDKIRTIKIKLKAGRSLKQSENDTLIEMLDSYSDKFDKVVRPVMMYLARNHHPHCSIIIKSDVAELLEGLKTVVTDEYIVD